VVDLGFVFQAAAEALSKICIELENNRVSIGRRYVN